MGTTTFSGPIKAGTIKDTTGTTVGSNKANVGFVLMAQSGNVVFAADGQTAQKLLLLHFQPIVKFIKLLLM
jgi:hypothetical protein